MKNCKILFVIPIFLIGFIFILLSSCKKDSSDDNQNLNTDTLNNNATLTIPSGWSKVGDINANNMIWSITSDASGNIYAAGYFTNAGGYCYVAKWNGTAWSDIGINANSGIFAITADALNNIYAVGLFTNGATSGGGNHYVAKWNGTAWSDIGQSQSDLFIIADAVGNVYNGLSKWNGSAWSNFSAIGAQNYGSVLAMASNSSGTLQYAGGDFSHTSGYHYVAAWNGSSWNEIGTLNANASINAIVTDNSGNIYAAGSFTDGNLPTTGYQYVAKWNGTTWSKLGNLNANGQIYSLAIDKNTGYIYASGYFHNANGQSYIAKWDGTTWSDLGNMSLSPTPIYVDATGKLYSVVASSDGKIYCVVKHD